MSDYRLKPDEKIDIEAILDDLEHYVTKSGRGRGASPPRTLRWGAFTIRICPSR